MQYPIELVGGPRDGEFHTLEEDLPQIRLANMPTKAQWIIATLEPQETKIEYEYTEYLRTRIERNGHRVYTYYNPRRNQ